MCQVLYSGGTDGRVTIWVEGHSSHSVADADRPGLAIRPMRVVQVHCAHSRFDQGGCDGWYLFPRARALVCV
eukprot:6201125-Pleurochrysis_carterae.AAC.5